MISIRTAPVKLRENHNTFCSIFCAAEHLNNYKIIKKIMKKFEWTIEDLLLLEREYPNGNLYDLSKKIGKPINSIYQKAAVIGIKRKARHYDKTLVVRENNKVIYKICKECGVEKKLSSNYYTCGIGSKGNTKYRSRCKQCVKYLSKNNIKRYIESRIKSGYIDSKNISDDNMNTILEAQNIIKNLGFEITIKGGGGLKK